MNLESKDKRAGLTAAYLLEYWANKGLIPLYSGLIDALRGETEPADDEAKGK